MKKFIPGPASSDSGHVSSPVRLVRSHRSVSATEKLKLFLTVLCLAAASANATTWYVDNTATGGSKNGASWANAWTSLSLISGVQAGDTVYISGGPSGSSQTYNVNSWAPPGGSAGNPVTYQIGQDSLHDGIAIFSGSGGTLFNTSSAPNYVAFTGQLASDPPFVVGDTRYLHFQTTGYNGVLDGGGAYGINVTGFRFAYVNMGNSMNANRGSVFFLNPCKSVEIDHNYSVLQGSSGIGAPYDFWIFVSVNGTTWDDSKIHDNYLGLPNSASGGGFDGVDGGGTGLSEYSNIETTVTGYPYAHSGGQHQDGTQLYQGVYLKIHDNQFLGMLNTDIFLEGMGSGADFNHVRIYNNICGGSQFAAMDLGGDAVGDTYNDEVVVNNIFTGPCPFGSFVIADSGWVNTVLTGAIIENNVQTGTGSDTGSTFNIANPGTDVYSVPVVSPASDFGNNYQLTASATDLIATGANYSQFFNNDILGNARPATGAWSIGPYQYGSTSSPPPVTLTVSPITYNAVDVDPNASGLQVYEGSAVQFSGAATYTGTSTLNWQWTYTVNGGSTVVYQSGSGSVPSISFNFATGTGGNTYVWTLLATAGTNSASSTLSMSVEVPPAPNTSLTFQAPSGTITAPFTVTGNYISQSVTSTTISATGEALYNFTITNAGNYVIQALVNAPGDSANSFYVNIDAQPADPTMCWDIFPFTSGFETRIASWRGAGSDTNNQFIPKIFSLAAGAHQIIFAGREAGTQLQSFSLLELPATPLGLHVLAAVNGSAPNFSAGTP
jgi:hypothetical protein